MRVLVNTTSLVKGGGVQVGASLVFEAVRDCQGIDWQFALSSQVAREASRLLDSAALPGKVFSQSPGPCRATRKGLLELASQLVPDAVFTVFGPTYVRFAQPHLMGCATPWVTNSTWLSYQTLPTVRERIRMAAWSAYCGWWLRAAQAWVTESPAVKAGMVRRLMLPSDKIAVVSNTCSHQYFSQARQTPFPTAGERVRLLCFAAAYPQKCLDLIPPLACELLRRSPHLDFEFVVTLPPDDPYWRRIVAHAQRLGVLDRIVNRGPIPVADGPALYRQCHVCFMPTVLECFTATYPEAWAMGLPVVTSDLDFSRAICGDAALYFAPREAAAAADQILALLASPALWERLTDRGRQQLQQLPTSRDRYLNYVSLLRNLVAGRELTAPCATTSGLQRVA